MNDCIIRQFSGCSCTTECLSPDLPIQKRLVDLQEKHDEERRKKLDSQWAYGIGSTVLAAVIILIAFWSVPRAIEAHHQQVLIAQEASVKWAK